MALRDKLRERVQPMLEPDEMIEQVFLTQSGPNPNWTFLTYIVMFWNKYWVVAVTDRSVAVFRASAWRPAAPTELAQRLPRDTDLGSASGALWSATGIPGEKTTWVHRRFYKDVRAAGDTASDSAATESA